ncbi:DUF6221 family protein [Streptomyces sp. NPDC006339]|uniref:DUF6221 family protein n=1 Tax=Streptomyces sp. NPDC006339 TaxID=3156755 RepID=UPI00339FBCFA
MSDDLLAFLRARLAKDEQLALAASPGPWRPDEEHDQVLATDGIVVAEGFALSGRQLRATVDHIARHDPVRVLVEARAKQQLLDEHQDVNDGSCGTCITPKWGYPTHGGSSPQAYPCATLRLLALPYADHEDYNEAWRP